MMHDQDRNGAGMHKIGAPEGDTTPVTGDADHGPKSVTDHSGTWVTLREAEGRTGVSRSTLRKWRKSGDLASRMEQGSHGPTAMVPIAAVEELAATRGAGRRRVSEDIDLPSPAQAVTDSQGGEAPRWAMELLSRADARTEHLLERLAQAERERASAERDAAIEKHRRERAETDAEDLRAELESLRGSDDAGSTDAMPERADTGAVGAAQPRRWWDRLRRTE